jgi:hypothetical protein
MIKNLLILSLLLIFIIFIFYSLKPKLLFESSFEKDTYILVPDRKDSTVWWQEIRSMQNSKISWPIKLQGEEGCFQMIVNNKNINDYIENRIETVLGINGEETKALHQVIKKKEHEWTQDPYVVYTKNKEQKKLYIKYSLKYPKNLSELLNKDSWLTFCQFKTTTDYRLSYYIYSDENSKLYWYVHGDNVVLDNVPYKEYWFQENRCVPVPVGKWFNVEIFWNRSSKENGRVWLAINGKVVIDYRGITKLEDPINEIMLFTNYASVAIEQWVDNIEIWSDFPCGIAQSCYDK